MDFVFQICWLMLNFWKNVLDNPKTFVLFTLSFCLVFALILPVDCFPIDGWFQTKDLLFKQQPGGDNFRPIAAPAYLYFGIDRLIHLMGLSLVEEFYAGTIAHQLMLFASGLQFCFIYRA